MAADRPEPLIYAAWVASLNQRLFGPKLGSLYGSYWVAPPLVTAAALREHPHWCGPDGCPTALAAALEQALDTLAARYGADMDRWSWGQAHQATFDHPVFSRIRVLRDLFDRRIPADGANDTVDAGGFRPGQAPEPFADLFGPGLRAVYDLADLDNSRFEMALGQSAHLLSPHYDDLLPLWRRFEGVRLPHAPAGDVLRLVPQSTP